MAAAVSEAVRAVMHAMTEQSDAERISFPEVVARLGEAGVERYHADLVGAAKTYYLPDGGAESFACAATPSAAMAFSAAGVEAAVRSIQRGEIGYLTFCERIADAGCVGYHVFLGGRRAVYYGRTGDSHVEWFPGAAR